MAVRGATIGAISDLADRLRDSMQTSGEPWPLATLRVTVTPFGPPDLLDDIALAILVGLIDMSTRDQASVSDPRHLAAWGAVPLSPTTGVALTTYPALVSVGVPAATAAPGHFNIRPVRDIRELRPMLTMTNGPP
jgi:hypothetical protein